MGKIIPKVPLTFINMAWVLQVGFGRMTENVHERILFYRYFTKADLRIITFYSSTLFYFINASCDNNLRA